MKKRDILLLVIATLGASGCATLRSLDAAAYGGPLVLGGTRVNLAALEGERLAAGQTDVSPPRYPLADLPFSLAMDIVMLPFVVPAAASLAVTGPAR